MAACTLPVPIETGDIPAACVKVSEDGQLVDVSDSDVATGLGYYQVALSRAVWTEVITPDPRAVPLGQCVAGRLHDCLGMLKLRLKTWGSVVRTDRGLECLFSFYAVMKVRQRRLIRLRAVIRLEKDQSAMITIYGVKELLH